MKRFLALLFVLFANAAIAQNSIVQYIMDSNPRITEREAIQIHKSVKRWAQEFDFVPALLLAIIKTESTFNKHAFNRGAVGLMQVIPRWHRDKFPDAQLVTGSTDLNKIDTNIYVGVRVLADCRKKFLVLSRTLTCYNGGGTRGYALKILSTKEQVKREISV